MDRARAESPPALVCSETPGAWFAPSEEAEAWNLIEAAVDLIAWHYRLDRDDVWCAVLQLEIERFANTGIANFGQLLERPIGFASLGIAVAYELMDQADANAIPLICLNYH